VLQRGLGVSMPKMGLHVFHACDLRHVRRACAPEHLMRYAIDAGIAAGFLEDTEKEIVRVDCGPTA
jgi:hypothetical protein